MLIESLLHLFCGALKFRLKEICAFIAAPTCCNQNDYRRRLYGVLLFIVSGCCGARTHTHRVRSCPLHTSSESVKCYRYKLVIAKHSQKYIRQTEVSYLNTQYKHQMYRAFIFLLVQFSQRDQCICRFMFIVPLERMYLVYFCQGS